MFRLTVSQYLFVFLEVFGGSESFWFCPCVREIHYKFYQNSSLERSESESTFSKLPFEELQKLV